MSALQDTLAQLLGPAGWLTGADTAGYTRDWLDRHGQAPLGVARPASTDEVAAVVRACHAAGVPIVAQGGNTGLCAAAVLPRPGGVILSLARIADIGEPDFAAGCIEVGAGVVLQALHDALEPSGLIFPMHLGAEGSARIGGLISTNAGGSHALRYGMMQDLVLGLEVVLPDGRVWNGLRAVQKDNAGYQLRRLFCGAEGTLGIVTRAVLKLAPAPRHRATALLAVPDVAAMLAFGKRLRADAGEFISGLEFFCDLGLDLALRHVHGLSYPLAERAPWYLLVELTAGSPLVPLDQIFEAAFEQALESGEILDGVLAANDSQRGALWRLREDQPEGQRLEGVQMKHDLSVPPGHLAAFIARGRAICERLLPGVRVNPFGHLGDGNTHFNLTPPEGARDFGDTVAAFTRELAALAGEFGGSFAAEHGLGHTKVALADALRSPLERELMARIKHAFDPDLVMNPGAVVR